MRQTLDNIKHLLAIILVAVIGSFCHSCSDEPSYQNSRLGNFDALSHIIDTRYCFFAEKDIDWSEVTARYREMITDETTLVELFDICSAMLDELKDGHVNLISPFSTSYYRNWWSDFPQDFNLRTLQQYYLDFDYYQTSGISYKIISEDIAYMYYPSFSSGIGQLNLDYIMALLSPAKALIIDIRDNGGGLLTNVEVLASRFITEETPGGSIVHKTGPGHDEFSEPYPFSYQPAPASRVSWDMSKPVFLLTNRSCYSAANDFVAVMKSIPGVTVVGARTGGGGGLPFSSELPNGWAVRFSASPIFGPDGGITEFGIDPDIEIHCKPDDLASGYDAILSAAILLAKATIPSE